MFLLMNVFCNDLIKLWILNEIYSGCLVILLNIKRWLQVKNSVSPQIKTILELSLKNSSLVGTGSCRATVFPVSENLLSHLHATGSGQAEAHVMVLESEAVFFVFFFFFSTLVYPLHTQTQIYSEFARCSWGRMALLECQSREPMQKRHLIFSYGNRYLILFNIKV